MVQIGQISGVNFSHEIPQKKTGYSTPKRDLEDTAEFSTIKNPPEVGTIRAVFGYLSQEQIDAMNKTRKLPNNVKISRLDNGKFYIRPNWFHISRGTHTIPEGFELRRNLAGFTEVVPIDEEGLMLRRKSV